MKKPQLRTILIIGAFITTAVVLGLGIYFSQQQSQREYSREELEKIADNLLEYPYTDSDNPYDNARETTNAQAESLNETPYELVNSTIEFENGITLKINDYSMFSDGTRFLTKVEALEMLNRKAKIEDIRYDSQEFLVIDIIFGEPYSV